MAPRFTSRQGLYLAFIAAYSKLRWRAPAEADLVRHFRVKPPSVHQMVLTLERKGFIARVPGEARSIRVLVSPDELPALEGEDTTAPAAPRREIRAGDWVRLPKLPPWVKKLPAESREVFAHCVGRAYLVEEIGEDGLLVLDVSWDVDELFGGFMNDIRVEPEYVERAEPRADEVAHRAIAGTWRITEMDAWDQDAVDLVAPGHFTFEARSRLGSFGFVAVDGGTDCVYSARDGRPFVEFSWLGADDGDPKNGRGSAELLGEDEMRGHIYLHQGMDSRFKATRDREALDEDRPQRVSRRARSKARRTPRRRPRLATSPPAPLVDASHTSEAVVNVVPGRDAESTIDPRLKPFVEALADLVLADIINHPRAGALRGPRGGPRTRR